MSDEPSATLPSSTPDEAEPVVLDQHPSGPLPDGLVLVSTPIGNLADLSFRALAILRQADLVLCEDTRVTSRLFAAHGIQTRLEALHEHNERQRVPHLIDLLRQGRRLALVSDAGTPLLSDPGYRLARAAIAEHLPVSAAPGPNAALMALTLSGLPPHPFLFVGFPPPREAARRDSFSTLRAAEQAGLSATLIWHEAPHRLADMLHDLAHVFGADREAVVARELTKRFEEVRRGQVAELAAFYAGEPARGEITVLVGPPHGGTTGADRLDEDLLQALREHSVKDAAALVAGATNLPKRVVYARALELSRTNK
ncbi:16S rRNA (cytidine(1402)-2'-O)-methyltransferase [Lichenicoccus roseus]|uniref:Ribosomal RNA small subunit methyltransferase I n=1 Tax=Lichenicoccus roseus TaxID=2683649 RepID=A0A5R9J4C4_9PROT|nr:16S rRNA (cytidine(1402)-2'-O)-methyltransferase [Lichenicoccus roseus]TLU71829.1 16S rRNA (cytidine(1402)-2'-O)-methyltransferase [Lichenicoccus roseus]